MNARFQTDEVYQCCGISNLRTGAHRIRASNIPGAPRKTASIRARARTSQSERDWAYVNSALVKGADPEELISQLARSRATDKSNPQYYARLTVTKAVAVLRKRSAEPPKDSEAENHRERN